MRRLWTRIKDFFRKVWEMISLVDWSAFITATFRAVKAEDKKIDPKYIVIKPRVLSDHNLWRGVACLRVVLSFIPATAILSPILTLGEMGFNIWKHIALTVELAHVKFPPIAPNTMRVSIQIDPELNKHYGHLTATHNWNDQTLRQLEVMYNDFSFITNWELLKAKYPHVDEEYIKSRCIENRDTLQESINQIEQVIKEHSHIPEVNHNIKEALEALKQLFPSMRDWALFNSEGFNEMIEAIDIAI